MSKNAFIRITAKINILCILILSLTSFKIMAAGEDLVPDAELRKAINTQLRHDESAPISKNDLEAITVLDWQGDYDNNSLSPRIKTLEGIQYAINLGTLSIRYADLSNINAIAAIKDLKKLTFLDLSASKLQSESLKYLNHLTSLSYLSIYYSDIHHFDYAAPFFKNVLNKFRADPSPEYNMTIFINGPINDFKGLKDYFTYKKEYFVLYYNMGEKEAQDYSVFSIARGIIPSIYTVYNHLLPSNTEMWNQEQPPIQLKDIWRLNKDKGDKVNVEKNIIDEDGKRALFCAAGDWRDDIGRQDFPFLQNMRIHEYFSYMARKTNGPENEYIWTDTVEEYFKLKQRDSKKYPGTKEYYYEGRDFNIVPYNPYSTDANDQQDTVHNTFLSSATVFYYEFKNFEKKVPLENGEGYYPTPYTNNGDTTEFILPGIPFFKDVKGVAYNSGQFIAFQQSIHWFDALDPYFTGVSDTTVSVGTAFDPLKGVNAYDPTKDADNPNGKTPTRITDSIKYTGTVNTAIIGKYTITYTVTNEYGKTAVEKRVITVSNVPATNDNAFNTVYMFSFLICVLAAIIVFLRKKKHIMRR